MSALDQLLLRKYQQAVASSTLPAAGQQSVEHWSAAKESMLEADVAASDDADETAEPTDVIPTATTSTNLNDIGAEPAANFNQPVQFDVGFANSEVEHVVFVEVASDRASDEGSTAEPEESEQEESVTAEAGMAAIVGRFVPADVNVSSSEGCQASTEQPSGDMEFTPAPAKPEPVESTAALAPAEPTAAVGPMAVPHADGSHLGREAVSDAAEVADEEEATGNSATIANADSAETETAKEPFKPQWEVDRFRWPKTCCDIDGRLEVELDGAIASLRELGGTATKAFLISSQDRNVGRSTIALCLARRAAMAGLRVALVDLDYEQPSLMREVGVASDFGIESLGLGQTTEGICIKAIEDRVTLCPLVKPTKLASEEVTAMLELLAEHHDLVVIDGAAGVEAMLTGRVQLGAVIVEDQRQGAFAAQSTREIAGRLRQSQVWTAGVVKNFAA